MTCRILTRAASVGMPSEISRSKRPARLVGKARRGCSHRVGRQRRWRRQLPKLRRKAALNDALVCVWFARRACLGLLKGKAQQSQAFESTAAMLTQSLHSPEAGPGAAPGCPGYSRPDPPECRVERVRAVGCANDDDVRVRREALGAWSPLTRLLLPALLAVTPCCRPLLWLRPRRQVVHAGEHLRHNAALHLTLRGLALGEDGVDLI